MTGSAAGGQLSDLLGLKGKSWVTCTDLLNDKEAYHRSFIERVIEAHTQRVEGRLHLWPITAAILQGYGRKDPDAHVRSLLP